MRRAALVVLLVGAAWVASASGARSAPPTLRLVDRAPLVLRGTAFRDGERVRIVVFAAARSSQVVHAAGNGAFVVRFNRSIGRCARFSVQAFGAQGSRAHLLATRVAPDCLPND